MLVSYPDDATFEDRLLGLLNELKFDGFAEIRSPTDFTICSVVEAEKRMGNHFLLCRTLSSLCRTLSGLGFSRKTENKGLEVSMHVMKLQDQQGDKKKIRGLK
jgi:hypothetical protein